MGCGSMIHICEKAKAVSIEKQIVIHQFALNESEHIWLHARARLIERHATTFPLTRFKMQLAACTDHRMFNHFVNCLINSLLQDTMNQT